MTEYAKFINANNIQLAPATKDNISNYHLMTDLLIADGYQVIRPTPPHPQDGKAYALSYRQIDNEIEPFWCELIQPEPNYYERRALSYPPSTEYLDAQVKINSGNPELGAAGQTQLEEYYQRCLAVKEQFPKPIEPETEGVE